MLHIASFCRHSSRHNKPYCHLHMTTPLSEEKASHAVTHLLKCFDSRTALKEQTMALITSPLPLNNFVPNGKFNIFLGVLIIPQVKQYNSENKLINTRGGGMGLNKAHSQHFINMGLLTLIYFRKQMTEDTLQLINIGCLCQGL